ncbi:YgaP family membrane protein [Cupriavidus alkaliphilus]|uniref:Enoyl-CoA hydratase/carnithine racemase n=1 Tax=Cupriavidus alkaliphilus TaxID=942866 RepID=A0A7W4YQU5_9BURK|nr:DUF2892 domain-containing protein [Cupriavidus alkaliphilus]MBB3006391.1 enoyl-CoA hydratase/carnithine racemase [Cupriavidus alkaliphilus]
MLFCKNLGVVDRSIRILVGAALITLVFVRPGTLWGWIGLVPLLTGVMGYCPAYRLFGKGC